MKLTGPLDDNALLWQYNLNHTITACRNTDLNRTLTYHLAKEML